MLYLEDLWKIFPAFQKEEIDKIFKDQHYGNLDRVWVTPGLVLVSTEGGQGLHSIYAHPVTSSLSSAHWSINVLAESPILDVVINPSPSDPATATTLCVIQKSGNLQCWQLGKESYEWKLVYRLNLCGPDVMVLSPDEESPKETDTTQTEVTSVCLLPDHHLLYWCERQRQGPKDRYSVYKIQLPGNMEDTGSQRKLIERTEILHNCPSCALFSLNCSILIVPEEMVRSGVPFGIIYTPMQSSCTLLFGNIHIQYNVSVKSGETLNFRTILLQYQNEIKKAACQLKPVLSCVFYPVKKQFIIIHQGGQLLVWQETSSGNTVGDYTLTSPDNEEVYCRNLLNFNDVPVDAKWTISYNYLLATNRKETRVWDLTDGEMVQVVSDFDDEPVLNVFMLQNSMPLSGLFSKEAIYIWQSKAPDVNTESLPEVNQYRSEALTVAALDQEKFQLGNLSAQCKLKNLQQNWSEKRHINAPTDYTKLTDPFLESYWLLEDFWQNAVLSDQKIMDPFPFDGSLEESIYQLLSPTLNLAPETRQIQLMILANQYPSLVLDTFKSLLDLSSDVTEKNLSVWQFILGLDHNDVDRLNLNIQVFEILCQLFFKEEPQQLVPFVSKAQQAYEINIGVAAFTRERHTKKVYSQAYSCLPDADTSKYPWEAIEAKVQLILKSESGHYILKSQDILLGSGHWESALSQLRQFITNKQIFRQLIHVTLKAMAKAQVLHQYMGDLSGLLTVNSHITLSELIKELVHSTEDGKYLQECVASPNSQIKTNNKPLYKNGPDIKYESIQVALCTLNGMDQKTSAPDESALIQEDLSVEGKVILPILVANISTNAVKY